MFKRIDKKTLANEIIDQILKRLQTGELQPGDRLPSEFELSEQLGVGRSSVREALKALEVLGIVVRSNDGSRISDASPLDTVSQFLAADFLARRLQVEHVYDARRILETKLCALGTENVTAEDIAALLQLCDAMEALDRKRIAEYVELDRTFHRTICGLYGNPILTRMWELAYDLYIELRLSVDITDDFLAVSNERHRRLVYALRDRNPDLVRNTVLELHQLGKRDISEAMDRNKQAQTLGS